MFADVDKKESGTLVCVFTDQHQYLGYLKTEGMRVADVLANTNSGTVELHKAFVATAAAPSSSMLVDELLLRKSQIILVIPQGQHEAPEQRQRRHTTVERHSTLVCLPGYTVAGDLCLPPRIRTSMLLKAQSGLPHYVAINDATVQASCFPGEPFVCPTVLAQVDHIESIGLGPVRNAPSGGTHSSGGATLAASSDFADLASAIKA